MQDYLSHLLSQAVLTFQSGSPEKAEIILREALKIDKKNLPALEIIGIIKLASGENEEAINYLQKACKISSESYSIQYNLAKALSESNKDNLALAHHKKAIDLNASSVDALINYGKSLVKLNKFDDALIIFERVLTLNPDDTRALFNLGRVLNELGDYPAALERLEHVLKLDPKNSEAWLSRGVAYKGLMRFKEAHISYQNAIDFGINFAEAYYDVSLLSLIEGRNKEAIDMALKAIEIKSSYADAYYVKAMAEQKLKQFDVALVDFQSSLALSSDSDWLLGNYMHTKMFMCDWHDFEKTKNEIHKKSFTQNICDPFQALSLFDDPYSHLNLAEKYSKSFNLKKFFFEPKFSIKNNKKIRIAYYSPDFRDHPITHLMRGVFKTHNKENFELFAFSFSPTVNDPLTIEVSKLFDRFIYINDLSDLEVVKISRDLEIDIGIDLCGYTGSARPSIFTHRVAPLQVNYLGYPGTLGSENYEYIIADKTLISPEMQKFYKEKIAYMPHSYQANDDTRKIIEINTGRSELGLPLDAFVFCCFNNSYKILPEIFSIWMNLLKEVDNSILWLLEDNSFVTKNLKDFAFNCGIDPNRIVFAKRVSNAEHLSRQRFADLFLDTFPYNAHTTASDALWADLPIITLQGQSFASRVASSLLNALDIPELITTNKKDYKRLALELAENDILLTNVKEKLKSNKLKSPLFNTQLFTHYLERIFKVMHERYKSGAPLENIEFM